MTMDATTIDDLTARIDGSQPVVRVQKDTGIWSRHPEDFYCEPEWCSTRLFATEHFEGAIVDPSCGLGRIVEVARDRRHSAG
jgi:hypothetical protein